MRLDLLLVLFEEADENLPDAALQLAGNGIEVALDVRQALVDIIAVRLLKIGHQPRHVSSQDGCR